MRIFMKPCKVVKEIINIKLNANESVFVSPSCITYLVKLYGMTLSEPEKARES